MSFEGILGYKAPNLPLIPGIVQGKLEGELAMYQKSFQAAFHLTLTGFLLERGLAGFPQFGKKSRIKFKLPGRMGRQKNRPKDNLSTIFLNNADLTAAL